MSRLSAVSGTTLGETVTLRSGVRAPNRLRLAPMTNRQSHDDGSLSDDELQWLERRAQGGFGVITTCAAHVTRDGQGWRGALGVYSDAVVRDLAASGARRGLPPRRSGVRRR